MIRCSFALHRGGGAAAAFAGALLVLAPAVCRAAATTYHVAPSGDDAASGTVTAPFRTLQRGVNTLRPGDTLLVAAGTYRETVRLERGGTLSAPVTIAARPGAQVIVSGADRLRDGWTKAESSEDAYVHEWPHVFPINRRPDGTLELTHPGDKEHELTGRAEQVLHEGRRLRQVLARERLERETFFVDLAAKRLYVILRGGDDPARTEVEASTRGEWLVGGENVAHVRLRGITFRYAANHAQRGAFRMARGTRNWTVEDCTFERTNAAGASLAGAGHVFRRCTFQDNGQLGFGASFCHDTRMESCSFYRNNAKGYSTGWEAGALKIALSRRFVLDRCRSVDNRGTGVWYDIGNEQSVVRNCYIADNDESGIFYEISYGLHAHDNVIVRNGLRRGEEVGGAWGVTAGITLSSSQDCVVEHNTLVGNRDGIAFREHGRTTPRIDQIDGAATEVRIFNKNHVIRNNLVAYSPDYGIALWFDVTFFGPHPGGGDKNQPAPEDLRTLNIRFADNLLFAPPGRPNYLYGAPWRSKSRSFATPAEFAKAAGISDTSRTGDPKFADTTAGDFRLLPSSPAATLKAGARSSTPAGRQAAAAAR